MYENITIISHKKIVDKTKVVNDIKAVESSQTKASEKSNEMTKASEKKTERISWSWWWLLLILIPIGYYVWQKVKDKIWFV